MDMQTVHIENLAEGYALGALDDRERLEVEQHIAVCPPCKQQVRSLEDTAQLLGFVASTVTPPLRCKRNVLAKIEREQFLATPTRSSRARVPQSVWASFAAVALVMMGVYGFSMRQQATQSQLAMASVQADLAQRENELQAMRTQVASFASIDEAITDGHVTLRLTSQGQLAGAKASCLMLPGKKEAWLVITGLEPLPADKAFQVWVARGEQRERLQMFAPAPTQKTMHIKITPSEPMDRYEEIMVTVEDKDGAPVPSGETVLFGDL